MLCSLYVRISLSRYSKRFFFFFQQYHSLQWNEITNDQLYPFDENDRLLSWRGDFQDYVEENFNNPMRDEVR